MQPHQDKGPIQGVRPADWIPHRPPILAVDTVDVAVPGRTGTGRRRFTPDEPWLTGHFPGRPLVPGVALIEGIAQTAAVVLLAAHDRAGAGAQGEGVLADVSRFRFRQPIVPPADVVYEVEVVGKFGALCKVAGRVLCGGVVCAEGEVVLSAEVK